MAIDESGKNKETKKEMETACSSSNGDGGVREENEQKKEKETINCHNCELEQYASFLFMEKNKYIKMEWDLT